MTSRPDYLNLLPPEIYPNIAFHLPLYSTPSTLLALALVNHRISGIILPLLYSCLILKNESDALNVIKRLLDEPELGKVVRELHILSDLSPPGENPFNVITGLENLIRSASIPYIHTLGLCLLTGWHYVAQNNRFRRVVAFGRFQSDFWVNIRKNCPRLRGLILRRIEDHDDENWVNDSGLLEMQDIASLTLTFSPFTLRPSGCEKLLQNIDRVSPNLHTLDIAPYCSESTPISPLLAMSFPKLRSLSLASFTLENSALAMAFWKRHPKLEFLKIFDPNGDTPWFLEDPDLRKALPNLKHLKVPFVDVRILSPILNQLISLTVYSSINAQVPYLLRAVLPDGLPNLKSLNISQQPSDSVNIEGALWYEREDGKFCEASVTKARRSVLDGYIPSIARGAPNIEELGFQSYDIELDEFIVSEIASFSKLRRFYFQEFDLKSLEDRRETMFSSGRILAEACQGLDMIVDTGSANPPYVVAKILRTEEGEVLLNVNLKSGFGMQIGSEDQPFPK